MTNEMLAGFIQQGGNDELIPLLWENVRKLLYMKSERFYRLHKDSCDGSGVEAWDIKQACYTAFLDAVKAFKPDSGNKFTSYLNYPFKQAVRELLRIRTGKRVILNSCTSLDKPIENSDGELCTMLDLVADDNAFNFVENAEGKSDAETIRAIVDTLSEPQKCVIQAYFFKDETLQAIAEKLHVSPERVRQIKAKALRQLRQNKQLQAMHSEQRRHYDWIRLARFKYSPEYFDIIKQSEERRFSYGQRQAAINSALYQWEQGIEAM
jgi:RNA polymerase sigma factor (sigma-70 family)